MKIKNYIIMFLTLFFVFLVFSNSVFSEELDDYFFSGEPISFNGKTYYGYIGIDEDSLLVTSEDFSSLIPIGKCEEHDFVEICFLNIEKEDYSKVKVDSNGNFIYPFEVSFKTTGPDLNVNLDFEKNNVDVDEKVKFNITLKNEGNRVSENNFVKVFYNSSCVVECNECTFGFDNDKFQNYFLLKESFLDVGEEKIFSFKTKLVKPENCVFYSEYNYSYNDKSVVEEKNLGELKVFVPYSFNINYDSSVSTGEYSNGDLYFKNLGSKSLYVNITIFKNESLKYYDLNDSYSFVLNPNEEKNIDFKMLSFESKTYTTKFDINLSYDDKIYNEKKDVKVTFKSNDLDVIYTFDKDKVVSNEKGSFYLSLKNNYDKPFKDIVVNIIGFFNTTKNLSVLNPNSYDDVIKMDIVYPKVKEFRQVYENITITYFTSVGEKKVLEKNAIVKVYPLNKSYTLKYNVKNDDKDNLNFEILGKNNVDSKIKVVKVFSKIKNLNLLAGSLENNNVVVDKNERALYGFTAKNFSVDYFVNTTAVLEYNNEKTNISILYYKGDLSKLLDEKFNVKNSSFEEKNVEENKNNSTGENIKENNNIKEEQKAENKKNEDEGFFDKILSFVIDLFTFN